MIIFREGWFGLVWDRIGVGGGCGGVGVGGGS